MESKTALEDLSKADSSSDALENNLGKIFSSIGEKLTAAINSLTVKFAKDGKNEDKSVISPNEERQLIYLSEAKVNYLSKNPDVYAIVNEFCLFASKLCFGLEYHVQQVDQEESNKIFEGKLSEFKQRYYELARQYHPDRNSDSEAEIEQKKEIFQAINEIRQRTEDYLNTHIKGKYSKVLQQWREEMNKFLQELKNDINNQIEQIQKETFERLEKRLKEKIEKNEVVQQGTDKTVAFKNDSIILSYQNETGSHKEITSSENFSGVFAEPETLTVVDAKVDSIAPIPGLGLNDHTDT